MDTTAAYTVGNLTANGTVSGTGFTNLLTGKENLITATAPLLKTSANGLTQLSLDTAAAYTVGSLTSTGQLLCGSIGTGTTALSIKNRIGDSLVDFYNLDTKAVTFHGPVTVEGICVANADINVTGTSYLNGAAFVGAACSFKNDINVTGTSYLNGAAAVGGGCSFNNDITVAGTSYLNGNAVVNGGTWLHTNAVNDVAVLDSGGVDTMRIDDSGDITLQKAGVVLSSSVLTASGLLLNTLTHYPIVAFKTNTNVEFYGPILTALQINASVGLSVKSGTNSLVVGNTNTYIGGPAVVSGTFGCGNLTCGAVTGSSGLSITSGDRRAHV